MTDEVQNLAKKFVDHVTDNNGNMLANVYENEAFKSLYDPNGAEQRKLRLPRKQLQVYNQYSSEKQLFQKVYYNPALTTDDESKLRDAFFRNSTNHDNTDTFLSATMFVAYWPVMHRLSKNVKPVGCLFFTGAYLAAYFKGVKAQTMNNMQVALNTEAAPYAEKYGLKQDADYLN
tara:strand:- start:66 stop:590 length:525 start_codon:yes stop_codon:yes gene_type:complete